MDLGAGEEGSSANVGSPTARTPPLGQQQQQGSAGAPRWPTQSPFLRALLDIEQLHEKEVLGLREELEAACRAREELEAACRALQDLKAECQSASGEGCNMPSPRCSSVAATLPDGEGAAAASRGLNGAGGWRRDSSRAAKRHCVSYGQSRQLLSEDLALIKGWKVEGKQIFVEGRGRHLPAARELVGNQAFDAFCSLMIVGNAMLMGVSVDWKVRHYYIEETPETFEVLDRIFSAWFLCELLLRLLGAGLNFFCAKDWTWNIFDTCVVSLDLAATLTQLTTTTGDAGAEADVGVVRLLRVLRITRALRIVRIFRFFRELRMMVFSVLRSGTSLVWSLVLFFMDIFLFAVYLTQQVTVFKRDVGEQTQLDEHFGTMTKAVYTLFMSVSGGISWVEVSGPLSQVHWSNAVVFTFFVFFTIYALTNIITGIFVDTAIQAAQSDRDEVIQTQLHNRHSTLSEIRDIFQQADRDGSGSITLQELECHLGDQHVRAHMASLGLQLDEARGLFRLLDMDKSGFITIDEFIFGCMRLKGNARSIDLATLMYENKKMYTTLASFFDYAESEFSRLQQAVDRLSGTLRGQISEPSRVEL